MSTRQVTLLLVALLKLIVAGPFILLPPHVRAQTMTGPEVLERLRAFDSAFTTKVTLTMDVERYRRSTMPEQGVVKTRTVLTTDGVSWAMRDESIYESAPVYRPLGGAYTQDDYDEAGNLLVWRDTLVHTFVGEGAAGRRTELTLYRIDPANRVLSVESGSPSVLLFAPDDEETFVNIEYLLRAAGRRFAHAIVDVDEPEVAPDGSLALHAMGNIGNLTGRWSLTVDPLATYMARAASFTVDGKKEPMIVYLATGTSWIGNLVTPELCEISLDTDRPEAVTRIRFVGAAGAEDTALLEEARQWISEPYARHTEIIDFRDPTKGPVNIRVQ